MLYLDDESLLLNKFYCLYSPYDHTPNPEFANILRFIYIYRKVFSKKVCEVILFLCVCFSVILVTLGINISDINHHMMVSYW